MRTRHLAYRTEQTYLQWIRRYVRFHQRKHPRDLGVRGVEQFLTHLAVDRKVSGAAERTAQTVYDRRLRHFARDCGDSPDRCPNSRFSTLMSSSKSGQ